MPLPLALALSSASSIATPIAFDWIPIIITSISSAIVSGTGGFFIARSLNKTSGILPNQGEKTLSEVSLLLDQTTNDTQNLQERMKTTDTLINNSVHKMDAKLHVISESNEQTKLAQESLSSLKHTLDISLIKHSGVKLAEITNNLGDSHQTLHKQQIAFSDIIEQLNTIGQQYQVDQTKTAALINTLTHLLQKETTSQSLSQHQKLETTLTQCMSELKQEKEITDELYTTIEALLSENDRLKKILNLKEEEQTTKTNGMRMFNPI